MQWGIGRQEKVGKHIPTIQEENGNEIERDSGETEEEDGDQNQDWDKQEQIRIWK